MQKVYVLRSTLVLAIITLFLGLYSPGAEAATFTVINTNDSGAGSLRQAIIDANATVGTDNINFSIGSGAQQIIPTSALPPITRPVVIDGTTQTGFSGTPLIELSGNGAGAGARGFYVSGNGAGSTIKGLIINNFSSQGIFIDTSSVTIVGNYIGTNASGTADAGNGGDGVAIFSGTSLADANSNIVGGTSASDRNVISGNNENGIGITAQDGGDASSNTVHGNYVGTNASGTGSIPNTGDGILINHAGGASATSTNNIIGGATGTTPDGACTGACNLVSGNTANGIGLWHTGVSGTTVAGNFVGTNASGTGAVANGNIGVEINETANNIVGGTTPSARNILSGNGGSGVFLTGAAATGNVVGGNYVGTNSSGNSGVGNVKMGIGIGASPGAVGANSNTIGGTTGNTPGGACTGSCNLISGNGENGIFISGTESFGNQFVGNYIGTNASGTGSIGNTLDGIGLLSTPNTMIGGSTANARNVISGNGDNGIIIVSGASTGNRIEGNYIGLNTSGSSLGNTDSGVVVSSATDTAILSNNIAFNGKLGIDLDNNGTPNLNDPNDTDSGANRLQNFPNIYAVKTVGSTTKIGGQFNGTPSTNFQLDFFSSDGCNAGVPNNYGEGQNFVGSTSISTDIFGNTAFGYTAPSAIPGGKYVTATATKKIGSAPAETSEFSLCMLVNSAKPALTNGAGWFLKNDLTTGPADKQFGYGFPATLLMCAWDPNQPGVKLPVVYSGGGWYMRASYTTGTADLSFSYGGPSFKAVCGDWDGDGVDTPGVVSTESQWLLRNSNSGGSADAGNFQFGPFSVTPVAGDWDGNGTDTIGAVTSGNQWYLRNSNDSGGADGGSPSYGHLPGYPIVGDWDGNGSDTIGSVNTGGTWSIRNANTSGAPNGEFQYGFPGAIPLIW